MKEIKVGQTWKRIANGGPNFDIGDETVVDKVDYLVCYQSTKGRGECSTPPSTFRLWFEFVSEPADQEIAPEPKVGETWVKTTEGSVRKGTKVVIQELYNNEAGTLKVRHDHYFAGTTSKFFLENYKKISDVIETSENPDKIKDLEGTIAELRYERDDFRQQVAELTGELQLKFRDVEHWKERFEKLELTNNSLRAELDKPKTPWYKKWKIV